MDGLHQIKQGGEDSFLGHSEQEYAQYLYKDVMSDITSSNDGTSKPDSVTGSGASTYLLKIIQIIIQHQEVNMITCLLTIQIVAHQVILVVQEIVQAILILPVITTQILHQQRTQVIQLITQQIIQLRTTVLTIVPHQLNKIIIMIIQITIVVYLTYLKQTRFLILEKRHSLL